MRRTAVDERYARLDRLGGGGMGEVYLAHDALLGREVALKILQEPHAENAEFVERFRREARHAAALSHPNVVQVYDAGETADGKPYMATEYVPGGTLRDQLLKRGMLSPRMAAGVALQIAEALHAAHERGVVHRDIKPENVLVTENGDVKVADFGIARAVDATAMTRTSLMLGTVHYLSPEQALGEQVGPASDLYSLGVVLYEMLTGEVPFEAEGPIAIAMRHLSQEPTPLRGLNPSVPAALDAVSLKLLEKDPEKRYGSAAELAEDLERFLTAKALLPAARTARIPPPARRKRPPSRRSRGLIAALLALLLAGLVVSIGMTIGLAQPVTEHSLPANVFSSEDRREPFRRALAPSTPAVGDELRVPEMAQVAEKQGAALSKEGSEKAASLEGTTAQSQHAASTEQQEATLQQPTPQTPTQPQPAPELEPAPEREPILEPEGVEPADPPEVKMPGVEVPEVGPAELRRGEADAEDVLPVNLEADREPAAPALRLWRGQETAKERAQERRDRR